MQYLRELKYLFFRSLQADYPRKIYVTYLYHFHVCVTNSLQTLHTFFLVPQLPICNGSRRYNMEKCILENLVWLNPYISQGIPSLNIPPYKSYHIAEYYDVHARSPNHKSTWINDLRLRGLMDYQISRVT